MEKVIVAGKNDGSFYDEVSENFGRCAAFCIADIESGEVMAARGVSNDSADFPRSAGAMVAGMAVNMGASAVIAGSFGPGSTLVLYRAGIRQYELRDVIIKDALWLFLDGNLECLDCSGILNRMISQNRFRRGNRMNWQDLGRGDEHYICSECGCMMPRSSFGDGTVTTCPNCGRKMK